MAQQVKNLPAKQETQKTQVQSLGLQDPPEKEMATRFSILAWEILHGHRRLTGYGSWGGKDSNMTEQMSTHTSVYKGEQTYGNRTQLAQQDMPVLLGVREDFK